ncbi:type II toxin-antitoxin system YafQ family toxin [Thiotrichales bacterium HSG1]|nr:type II toxin-antitoxin system YafQ family toxin [Thiotrichales bacterium HSG1]
MSRVLYRHKSFLKDWKKVRLSDKHFTKFIKYSNCLMNDEPLPFEAYDHSLLGEYKDFREFHLGSNMLVIYSLNEDGIVYFSRIGTHNQLFKNI